MQRLTPAQSFENAIHLAQHISVGGVFPENLKILFRQAWLILSNVPTPQLVPEKCRTLAYAHISLCKIFFAAADLLNANKHCLWATVYFPYLDILNRTDKYVLAECHYLRAIIAADMNTSSQEVIQAYDSACKFLNLLRHYDLARQGAIYALPPQDQWLLWRVKLELHLAVYFEKYRGIRETTARYVEAQTLLQTHRLSCFIPEYWLLQVDVNLALARIYFNNRACHHDHILIAVNGLLNLADHSFFDLERMHRALYLCAGSVADDANWQTFFNVLPRIYAPSLDRNTFATVTRCVYHAVQNSAQSCAVSPNRTQEPLDHRSLALLLRFLQLSEKWWRVKGGAQYANHLRDLILSIYPFMPPEYADNAPFEASIAEGIILRAGTDGALSPDSAMALARAPAQITLSKSAPSFFKMLRSGAIVPEESLRPRLT